MGFTPEAAVDNWSGYIGDKERMEQAARMVEASERLVLVCHVRPDGDAIGSMTGLGLILQEAGREVVMYCEDEVPETLSFLPGTAGVVTALEPSAVEGATLVVLDCSEKTRIGRNAQWLFERCARVVVLDHHLPSAPICEGMEEDHCVEYVDTSVCATGVLVLLLAHVLGWPVGADAAACLYTALLTDTGGFRNSNTDELALAAAHALVRLGARPYEISSMLFNNYPPRKFRLLALVLKTLEFLHGGKVAIIQATPDMFKAAEARKEDTEEFVNMPRSIAGVEVAAFIKEIPYGQVSVSLRSKNWADVSEIARRFGGGGHRRAAGFRVSGSASEARIRLMEAVEEYFDTHEAGQDG